jgi:hypothetical protein
MPNFIITEDDSNDVISKPKINESKRAEVGDYVSYPCERGAYAMGYVSEVRPYFNDIVIEPLAMDIGKVTVPDRFVVVQRKGVKVSEDISDNSNSVGVQFSK